MNVFEFRDRLIQNYASYIDSFIRIREPRIAGVVHDSLDSGMLWPEPLIQLNPAFAPGAVIDDLVQEGVLHAECARIFRVKNDAADAGKPLRLHRHQDEAIRTAHQGHNYVLTTGTGSGKSLAYLVPIVDHVLRHGSGGGIKAIVVYPMNALANSQLGELDKYVNYGYEGGRGPVRFRRYTGQESDEEKKEIIANPPDILLTNYVMLELILTRPGERALIQAANGLRFLVLDELHTYRGRQGADVALLVRRVRDRLAAEALQYVGTSATLAGGGSDEQRRAEVAAIASRLFGAAVEPAHVIGETLRRATPAHAVDDPLFRRELAERVGDPARRPPPDLAGFSADPLNRWIESVFGVVPEADGRLMRAVPRAIDGTGGAAGELSGETGAPADRCAAALRESLLAGYECERDPRTGKPPFAFRLHQFISRGDTVYASLEPEARRHITLQGQQFVPGDRGRVLLPLVFCRECGQEYYCVHVSRSALGRRVFQPRELSDTDVEEDERAGFLFYSTEKPWPSAPDDVLDRLPQDWLEEVKGTRRVRKAHARNLPEPVHIGPDGRESPGETAFHLLHAPFRFCVQCGVVYSARQRSDFGKLSSLSSEGRSTATTITSLFAIRGLREDDALPATARKLLSFTDNRQDAALQAGHFNDFVEIGRLRAALYRAVQSAGTRGIRHSELSQAVFDALELPPEAYTGKGNLRRAALDDAEHALREVLGYRLYRDLRRGWRVTAPNLEQCGLLRITYPALAEVCADESLWAECHAALALAAPATRERVARVLLDHMRREMAIRVTYLDRHYLERVQQESAQHLIAPWRIDEDENLEPATVLFPTSSGGAEGERDAVYLSPRGGFGQFLRRASTFPECHETLRLEDTDTILRDLLKALEGDRLVEAVVPAKSDDGVPGYQLPASAMRWVAGDGVTPYHDPVRVPNESETGGTTNRFFVDFYHGAAGNLNNIEAREHTAQVPYDERLEREAAFRAGTLPLLYCSPTMELGVDISDLNVVNLRNMPPTPANYAQRSGRAGRNNQPALVFTYCATGNSHDQYFFKRPREMVAGAVVPPRIDLANEDLVRAHVQAIWLAETSLDLGSSLKGILDMEGEEPRLTLLETVRAAIGDDGARRRAAARARHVLDSALDDLAAADWYSPTWLDDVLAGVGTTFDRACERWRDLYLAALKQARAQDRIIRDASRGLDDKRQAEGLRREAEAQLKLLTETANVMQSDFYSYRYIASEGFLPGYSFPRLPLAAFIPGRRGKQGREEFLSRPRFLAISEFGPRAIVYHEGSRYLINKVILPIREDDVLTQRAKQCDACGYLHPLDEGEGPDLCQHCGAPLPPPLRSLLRMQNVSTKRRDKINSDEEERFRVGYELRTGLRFEDRRLARHATVNAPDGELARLTYGHAATIWRVNLGWKRRKNKAEQGFVLDVERGYWGRNKDVAGDEDDPLSQRTRRVTPFVQDRRNCLLFEPAARLDEGEMASLQAALKSAIQIEFQLEDNEIAVEPLPDHNRRRLILLYESAEGGAGALRRLLDDPAALGRVARHALALCHYDPDSGADQRRAENAREDCEAACYNCLMSYGNQGDHGMLDRAAIKDLLLSLAGATVAAAPSEAPALVSAAPGASPASQVERAWLQHLERRGHRLPSRGGADLASAEARPDFLYEHDGVKAAIYVDGGADDEPDRHARDAAALDWLEDRGYTVLRFAAPEQWDDLLNRHAYIFGVALEHPAPPDLDLFDRRWHTLLRALAARPGVVVDAGGDVARGGRVAGAFLAQAARGDRVVYLVDGADADAESVCAALQEQGRRAVVVAAHDAEGALDAVLDALEGWDS